MEMADEMCVKFMTSFSNLEFDGSFSQTINQRIFLFLNIFFRILILKN